MMCISHLIKQNYEYVKKEYLKRLFSNQLEFVSLDEFIPSEYRSHFVNIGGAFETTWIFQQWLPNPPASALIVGPWGGRDYFYMKLKGYDVVGLDLTPVPGIDNLVIGNAEQSLPFKNGTMDVVILSEVLEHFVEDAKALRFVREVLKDDGILIVSVPYYNDKAEYHVRIFSPKTISRLLLATGFQMKDYVERPGVFRIPSVFNKLHHLLNFAMLRLFSITSYQVLLPLIARFETFLGRRKIPFRSLSNAFGAYLVCSKGEQWDYILVNRFTFN